MSPSPPSASLQDSPSVFPALCLVPGKKQALNEGFVEWMNEPDLCQSLIIYKSTLSSINSRGLFLVSLPCPPRGSAQSG